MRLGRRQGLWWGWQTADHLLPSHFTLFQSILLSLTFYKGDNILLFCYPGEIRDSAVIYCGIIRPSFIRKLILINGSINWGQVKSPLYQPQPDSAQISISPLLQASEAGGGWILWLRGILGKNIWYLGFWVLKLLKDTVIWTPSNLQKCLPSNSCLLYHHPASSPIISNVDWALDILILDWWLYDNYHWVRDYRRILPTQHIFHSQSQKMVTPPCLIVEL